MAELLVDEFGSRITGPCSDKDKKGSCDDEDNNRSDDLAVMLLEALTAVVLAKKTHVDPGLKTWASCLMVKSRYPCSQ